MPHAKGLVGCVKNLTFTSSDHKYLYDLGNPADGENYEGHCDRDIIPLPSIMPFNMNFLIAIVVSLAVLVIIIATLAIYKKRKPVYR